MSRTEEFDWIFDYSLQFLESDKFDAALMDFVDEKCLVFEDAEENKLIYTEIHREFCDHVEALISSNLAELGITTELFLESCKKARSGRDINATVFERLTAMEDFQTFKKLMTKRNTELQLEAIRSFKVNTPMPTKTKKTSKRAEEKKSEGKSETNSPVRFQSKDEDTGLTAVEREELRALQQSYEMGYDDYDNLPEEDIQELLYQSLIEMELLHRQEELEHAELEKALLMSLAVEEDHLSQLMAEMKDYERSLNDDSDSDAKDFARVLVDAKESKATSRPFAPSSSLNDAKALPAVTSNLGGSGGGSMEDDDAVDSASALKPLKGLRGAGLKPLPSIGSSAASIGNSALQELQEKKRQTEEALRRGQEQLAAQRRSEEELRQQLQGIAPKEADERARHMQQQRELLLAKKKEERDKKARIEEERRRKIDSDGGKDSIGDGLRGLDLLKQSSSTTAEDNKAVSDEVADMRRATMRMALARRLKLDVSAEADAKQQAAHLDETDRKSVV